MIDAFKVHNLVSANRGKKGFTYTHHDMRVQNNIKVVQYANMQGFTVNLSANNLEHADELKALNCGPVVTIVPADYPKSGTTPAGHSVVLCPATYRDDIQCSNCGICAVADRKAIIAFPVHGSGKNKAHKVFMLTKVHE